MIRDILSPVVWPLEQVLAFFHGMGFSWGWSIVALTIVVRIIILPLSLRQMKMNIHSQAIAPYVDKIKADHQDADHEETVDALVQFYQEHGGHPLGFFLPLLPQLPIFFGLFLALTDPNSLISGSWLFMPDLTSSPQGMTRIIIVLILAVTTFLISRLSILGKVQPRQIPFILLPLLSFSAFAALAPYPQGLTIYWIISNIFTCLLIIYFRPVQRRHIEKVREKFN